MTVVKMSRARPVHLARRMMRAAASPWLTYKGMSIARIPGRSTQPHIFVAGIPRAGTTLLASIFAGHPHVAALKTESHIFRLRNFQYLSLPDVSHSELKRMILSSKTRAELVDRISEHTLATKPGATRFLEKTPGHAQSAVDILNTFEQAKMVVALRNPFDAYASLQNSETLPSPRPQKYAELWNNIVTQSFAAPSDRIHVVQYENFVLDAESCVKTMCGFLGLEFMDELLDPSHHQSNAPNYHQRGDHDRIGDAITASSIGRWKTRLSPETVEILTDGCKAAMPNAGYDVSELLSGS